MGPGGQLIQGSDGNFYGVTIEGGVNVKHGGGRPFVWGHRLQGTP
jgi:hypothetical protein